MPSACPLRVMRVRLTAPGGMNERRLTPSVIVCNNEHQVKIFGLEGVSHPDRDKLNFYLAKATHWYGLVGLFVRALFRRTVAVACRARIAADI